MDPRQLEYFLSVVDHHSFTAAARHLHVTQPALSTAIKRLEAECGIPLLIRGSKGVRVSDAGEQLAHDARRILADLAATSRRMRSLAQGRAGSVSLAVAPAFEWSHLPHVLAILDRTAPEVDLDVQDTAPGAALTALDGGTTELGIMLTSDPPALQRLHAAQLHVVPAVDLPLVALLPRCFRLADQESATKPAALQEIEADGANPAGPVATPGRGSCPDVVGLEDLAASTWLIPDAHVGFPGLPELLDAVWRTQPNARPTRTTRVTSLQSCIPLVAAGRGVAVAPAQVTQVIGHAVHTARIREPLPPLTAVVAWHRHQPLSPAARRVKDVLLDPETWGPRTP